MRTQPSISRLILLAMLVSATAASATVTKAATGTSAANARASLLGNEPPRPLDERGLTNLTALTHLIGLIRFFHPTDAAREVDWESFTIRAVRAVESAPDDAELADRLHEIITPIAPLVQVGTGPIPDAFDIADLLPRNVAIDAFARWSHLGLGEPYTGQATLYTSTVERAPAGDEPEAQLDVIGMPLVDGVWCRLPLAVPVAGGKTVPVSPDALLPPDDRPADWQAVAEDRATRLAGVIFTWSTLEHFFPYFDDIDTDWDEALIEALSSAATDKTLRDYVRTLRRLVWHLHDGHGRVHHPALITQPPIPLDWHWVEDQLLVIGVADDVAGVKPGDIVRAIDGRPIDEIYQDLARVIPAGTEDYRRSVIARHLLIEYETSDVVELEIESTEQDLRTVRIDRQQVAGPITSTLVPVPGNGEEIAPGIVYFDLRGTRADDFEDVLDRLAEADGIVFDMRGYPDEVGARLLFHLATKRITTSKWSTPLITRPGREHAARHHVAGWRITPSEPYLGGNVAVLTDGRALSYAESCLGVIAHYELAEIVGSPSGGANGNVNPFPVPGGARIVWTGMEVRNHDGSQLFAVGVQPTVPIRPSVEGMRAGRDEVLEMAIEVLRERANRSGDA